MYRNVAGLPVSVRADLDVPKMKDGRNDFKDAVLTALLYTCRSKT